MIHKAKERSHQKEKEDWLGAKSTDFDGLNYYVRYFRHIEGLQELAQ